MNQSESSSYKSKPHQHGCWGENLLTSHRQNLVACVEHLLKCVQPLRGKSLEINQLVQELTFLHASLTLDLRLPKDWFGWLSRILRNAPAMLTVEGRDAARELMILLNDPASRSNCPQDDQSIGASMSRFPLAKPDGTNRSALQSTASLP